MLYRHPFPATVAAFWRGLERAHLTARVNLLRVADATRGMLGPFGRAARKRIEEQIKRRVPPFVFGLVLTRAGLVMTARAVFPT